MRKSAFVPDTGVSYDSEKHQSSTLYAGTTVQQVWNAEDTEDEVLAMVCRTGLNTQMGSMLRELVAPSKQAAESDTFVKVSFLPKKVTMPGYLFILLPIATGCRALYLWSDSKHGQRASCSLDASCRDEHLCQSELSINQTKSLTLPASLPSHSNVLSSIL